MREGFFLLLAPALAGCHIIAGYDDLEFREDSELVWATRFGDLEAQRIDEVVLQPSYALRVLGTFEGTFDLVQTLEHDPMLEEPSRFIAEFDSNGLPLFSAQIDDRITVHQMVRGSDLTLISYADTVEFLDHTMLTAPPGATDVTLIAAGPGGLVDEDDYIEATLRLEPIDAMTLELETAVATIVPAEDWSFMVGLTFDGVLSVPTVPECAIEGEGMAVASIDRNGVCLWLVHLSASPTQVIDAIGATASGDVVVAGRNNGGEQIIVPRAGGGELVLEPTGTDSLFLIELDRDGLGKWARSFGESLHFQEPPQLDVRDGGIITLAGYFEGPVDFGLGVLSTTQGSDLYVAKLDPQGNTVWVKQIAMRNDPFGTDMEEVLEHVSLAVDTAGNTIVAGHFRGEVDFGGTTRSSNGELDMFLFKLDVDGDLLWSGAFGDGELQCQFDDCATALAIDPEQRIVLGGGFYSAMDLGTGDMISAGDSDAFLALFKP